MNVERENVGHKEEELGAGIAEDPVRKDITAISADLKQLNREKDTQYREKDKIIGTLNQKIQYAKELKVQKKEIDDKIKKFKQDRDKANKEVKQISEKLKKLKPEPLPNEGNQFTGQKKAAPIGPLKRQIEDLELKMQTEPQMDFKKEERLMKQLKDLQKQLRGAEEQEGHRTEYRNLKNKLIVIKKTADGAHAEIQKHASESTKLFNELTKLSEEIAEEKKKKSSVQNIIDALRRQMGALNSKLTKVLKDWSKEKPKGAPDFVGVSARKPEAKKLKEEAEQIKTDFFKKGMKITTDQLRKIQGLLDFPHSETRGKETSEKKKESKPKKGKKK